MAETDHRLSRLAGLGGADGPEQSGREVRILFEVYMADWRADPTAMLRELATQLASMARADQGFTLEDLRLIARGADPNATIEQMAAARVLIEAGEEGQLILAQVAPEGIYCPLRHCRRAAAWAKACKALNTGKTARGLGKQALMRGGLSEQQAIHVLRYWGTSGGELGADGFEALVGGGYARVVFPAGDGDGAPPVFVPTPRTGRLQAWLEAFDMLSTDKATRGLDKKALMKAGLTEQQAEQLLLLYGTRGAKGVELVVDRFDDVIRNGYAQVVYPQGEGHGKPVGLRSTPATSRLAAWLWAFAALHTNKATRGLDKHELMAAGLTETQAEHVLQHYGSQVGGRLALGEEDFCNLLYDGHLALVYPQGEGDGKPVQLSARSRMLLRLGQGDGPSAAAQLAPLWPPDGKPRLTRGELDALLAQPERDAAIFDLLHDEGGTASREDMIAAIEDGLVAVEAGKLVFTRVGRAVSPLMRAADADGDGLVTGQELARAAGLTPAEADTIIRLFGDPDDPDTLSPSELASVFEEGVLVAWNGEATPSAFVLSRSALLLAQLGLLHEPRQDAGVSIAVLEPRFTPRALEHIERRPAPGTSRGSSDGLRLSEQALCDLVEKGELVLGADGRWDLVRTDGAPGTQG